MKPKVTTPLSHLYTFILSSSTSRVGSCLVVWVASDDSVCSECRCCTQGRLTGVCMITLSECNGCSWKIWIPTPFPGSLASRGAAPFSPPPGQTDRQVPWERVEQLLVCPCVGSDVVLSHRWSHPAFCTEVPGQEGWGLSTQRACCGGLAALPQGWPMSCCSTNRSLAGAFIG